MDEKSAVEYEAWLNECYKESETEPDFDKDLKRLLEICKKINQSVPDRFFAFKSINDLFRELLIATNVVEAWYENTDDPRENGWVDSKGRP